ncbi:hypothetical protein [Listeria ilorinensis]|uniref:hypothetical protein n=1 Tax=Listeria ilorinensis TaxID=2867439 RepID=UPI001EF55B3A|nr:hypothetical protein [Listeria ilorinensis]
MIRPDQLKNPNPDLRYVIPDRLIQLTSNQLSDDGYDYIENEYMTMAIFLKSAAPLPQALEVIEFLKTETFLENNLYEACMIAICDNNQYNIHEYKQIHPKVN